MGVVHRCSADTQLTIVASCTAPDQEFAIAMYIQSSINRHFTGANSYPIYFEGDDRTSNLDVPIFVEVRIDGPFINKLQKNYERYYYEINVLITAHEDPKDMYVLQRCLTYMLKFFSKTIPIYDDNGTLLGCLSQHRDRIREQVEANQYGRIKEDTHIQQATIEAHYIFDNSTI